MLYHNMKIVTEIWNNYIIKNDTSNIYFINTVLYFKNLYILFANKLFKYMVINIQSDINIIFNFSVLYN